MVFFTSTTRSSSPRVAAMSQSLTSLRTVQPCAFKWDTSGWARSASVNCFTPPT